MKGALSSKVASCHDRAPKRNTKRSNDTKSADKFGGIDPAIVNEIMQKIPPNPLTGKADILDVVRFIEQHPEEVEGLVEKIDKLSTKRPKVDLKTYNYSQLEKSIVHESLFVLQLDHFGYVDQSGNSVELDTAQNSTGIRPTFVLYCYDDSGAYRVTQECIGLPSSAVVLEAIQRAIACPEIPLKPCLPWFFLLSIKLSCHADALRPFLDTLPKPFHWRVETREEAQGVNDGVDNLNKDGKKNAKYLAEKAKVEGNKAFVEKDIKKAVDSYKEALSFINDICAQKPDETEEKEAKKLQAICLANRAAAYLLSGEEVNLEKALEDGRQAEQADPGYAKAYIRQASSLQALGQREEAKDVIARALERTDLKNDTGLVDRLIELVTDGKGFSSDGGEFKKMMLGQINNNRKGSGKLSEIKGSWEKRCNEHLKNLGE